MDTNLLSTLPAFADLTEEEQERIAAAGDVIDVPPGALLTAEGEFGYSFFIVEEGTAEVSERGVPIARLETGDFFGEIGLLVTGRRTASVTATSPMRLFALFEQDFRRLCAEVPAFERRVREAMAERLGRR
jgi:CRP-like cAMP-binding protein